MPDDTKVKFLEADINSCKQALARAEADYRAALADLTKRGHVVAKMVADSNGKRHRTKGINFALRVLREAEQTIRRMKRKISELEGELAAQQAPEILDEHSKFLRSLAPK